MSDFCKQDAQELRLPTGDAAGLCKEDEMVSMLCETCGPTWVDCTGTCVGPCDKGHAPTHCLDKGCGGDIDNGTCVICNK